jgi:hypothetical protein
MPYEKLASFLSIGTFVHQIQFNINPEFVNQQNTTAGVRFIEPK